MTRFAPLVSLGERWLERRGRPRPDLEDRLAFWRAREASFVRHATFDIEEPGPRFERGERGDAELWFPIARVARDARSLLRAHFDLASFDARWEADAFARAPSWLDARRELASLPAVPSQLLERLRDPDAAEALAFEAHDPPSHGHGFERYPDVLSRIAASAPSSVRAWDAGCGTGEGTWSLASALGAGRTRVEVTGTTPSPWELTMARRRGRPHDRARTLAHRSRVDAIVAAHPHVRVSFEPGDLRDQTPASCDVVLVAGVLGGVLASPGEVESALRSVARSLAPEGRAWVVDRFRADRHERAARLIAELAPRAGLRFTGACLERRAGASSSSG